MGEKLDSTMYGIGRALSRRKGKDVGRQIEILEEGTATQARTEAGQAELDQVYIDLPWRNNENLLLATFNELPDDPEWENKAWESIRVEARQLTGWMYDKYGNMSAKDPKNMLTRLSVDVFSTYRETPRGDAIYMETTSLGICVRPRDMDMSGNDYQDLELLKEAEEMVSRYRRIEL